MRVLTVAACFSFGAGLLLAAAIGFAQQGHGHEGHVATAGPVCSAGDGGFAQAMERAMAVMMRDMHAPPPSGDPDRDFLAMMVPHHRGAVEMARLVLAHGRDPLTRQLAEHVLATQQVEIAAMEQRLTLLAEGRSEAYPALSGTRGP